MTELKKFKIAAIALVAFLASVGAALAQSGGLRVVPMGYCYSTSLSAATKLPAFTCNMADGGTIANEIGFIQSAAVCVYTAAVVWRDDGAVPTGTPPAGGEGVSAGSCFPYWGNFQALQFIGSGAGVGLMLYK